MKTTLEIPDAIFRHAKARAALRGVSLRQFVTEALQEKVVSASAVPSTSQPAWMQAFGVLADLKNETRKIEAQITETFEHLDEEDRG